MVQQVAYNPYAPQGNSFQGSGPNMQANQNPFMNQQSETKTISLPTWLFWLIIVAFLGFASWLVWFMYFK